MTVGATANRDAPTYYVSTDGSDVNDGLSWRRAKATIAGALAAIGGTSTNTNQGIIRRGAD
jgi:hypothetical protein